MFLQHGHLVKRPKPWQNCSSLIYLILFLIPLCPSIYGRVAVTAEDRNMDALVVEAKFREKGQLFLGHNAPLAAYLEMTIVRKWLDFTEHIFPAVPHVILVLLMPSDINHSHKIKRLFSHLSIFLIAASFSRMFWLSFLVLGFAAYPDHLAYPKLSYGVHRVELSVTLLASLICLCGMVHATKSGFERMSILRSLPTIFLITLACTLQYEAMNLCFVFLGSVMWNTFSALGDKRIPIKHIFARTSVIIGLSMIIMYALAYLSFSTYPRSEMSYAGNVNLRYLSPLIRRNLRNSVQLDNEFHTNTAISLYLPDAGFLYTDYESLYRSTLLVEKDMQNKADRNVVQLRDRIQKMEPWYLERALVDHNSYRVSLDRVAKNDVILSEDLLFVKHAYLNHYLSVDRDSATEGRCEVDMVPELDPSAMWSIQYKKGRLDEEGFRLWSSVGECWLSTTWRTISGADEDLLVKFNRSDSRQYKMILEVTYERIQLKCVANPNLHSSTFFAIDSGRNKRPNVYSDTSRSLSTSKVEISSITWFHSLFIASLRLRGQRPDQDTSHLNSDTTAQRTLSSIFLITWVLTYLIRASFRQRKIGRSRKIKLNPRLQFSNTWAMVLSVNYTALDYFTKDLVMEWGLIRHQPAVLMNFLSIIGLGSIWLSIIWDPFF